MKTIEFALISLSDNHYVLDLADIKRVGMNKNDIIDQFRNAATWHKVKFRPSTYSLKRDIDRLAQAADGSIGFRQDPSRLPAAQVVAVVEKWTLDDEVSMEAFDGLEMHVADYLHSQVMSYLYPNLLAEKDFTDFFASFAPKQPGSEAKCAENE